MFDFSRHAAHPPPAPTPTLDLGNIPIGHLPESPLNAVPLDPLAPAPTPSEAPAQTEPAALPIPDAPVSVQTSPAL
ncbi:hypothetical protein B0H13DRAFT_2323896 [Mycena leptocephala]|nr:hypothetical protein B0H13DRAFT_2323896 [Mycena leptocephala]